MKHRRDKAADFPLRETVERIEHYESLLRELERIVSGGAETAGEAPAARVLAEALEAYYGSEDWKRDFAADEAGLLPHGLRRGVLSEDGIWLALEAYRERLEAESERKDN